VHEAALAKEKATQLELRKVQALTVAKEKATQPVPKTPALRADYGSRALPRTGPKEYDASIPPASLAQAVEEVMASDETIKYQIAKAVGEAFEKQGLWVWPLPGGCQIPCPVEGSQAGRKPEFYFRIGHKSKTVPSDPLFRKCLEIIITVMVAI
jgi:hypothetical protein